MMITGLVIFGVMMGASTPAPPAIVVYAQEHGYKACRYEMDPKPCYWNATVRGNGKGRSFLWTGDEVFYGYSE